MKITVEMPQVATCTATSCAYNHEQSCHARAITIGDDQHAACDTFFARREHTEDTDTMAGVGACKVTDCRHNQDLECSAEWIHVGIHRRHADCMTFTPS